MTRSPDSQIPSAAEQSAAEKRDEQAFNCRQEGEANLRAATEVNAVSASLTPPAITPIQLDLFPGRACVLEAKPATIRSTARKQPNRRDGVSGGSTQRQTIKLTGETLFGPAEKFSAGREAHKGGTRKRRSEAGQGVGGGRSTDETRDNRAEGRAATFIQRTKQGKAAGLPPQGSAPSRRKPAERKAPERFSQVVQMAVKIVIEPLFDADFMPCSFGFRPKKTPRMALKAIVDSVNEGYFHVVDVDLQSYFDTIDHELLMRLVERRVGDVLILRLIRAWLKAGVMEEGRVTHPDRGSPQGGVISPLLSNIFLHEVDRQWCRSDGVATGVVRLVRYADDMVLLTQTEQQARTAWVQLQREFTELHLTVNQEKSRLTTLQAGFAFLGFEFRKAPGRMLLMWPRTKACRNIRQRVREVVRSFPSNESVTAVIRKLNPVLNGWCTYFRVGNSNRTFHKVDWAVRSEVQLWLRRKHQCAWGTARGRWNYYVLHDRCRLYRMVGKVSHLEGLRRTLPEEDDRRAGCGKSARPVR